jgi:hypothetical protein
MNPTRKVSRRSFLAAVAGTAALAAAITVVPADEAEAQSGCTDSDSGSYADQAGNGRRCGRPRRRAYRSGCTDSDSGRYSDPAGNGRCRRRVRRSCTDSDGGRYADRAGHGRRC